MCTAILSDKARCASPCGDARQIQQGCTPTYIYIYVHVYLLNAAACMSACMGTLNLLSRVTASTSTIIRRTTYVMRVLQCARASSMQTSKQSLHEVTSGTANHCVEDNSQVSIKHRIYMLTAGIKRCASCLN